jgi:hypothetical protein
MEGTRLTLVPKYIHLSGPREPGEAREPRQQPQTVKKLSATIKPCGRQQHHHHDLSLPTARQTSAFMIHQLISLSPQH